MAECDDQHFPTATSSASAVIVFSFSLLHPSLDPLQNPLGVRLQILHRLTLQLDHLTPAFVPKALPGLFRHNSENLGVQVLLDLLVRVSPVLHPVEEDVCPLTPEDNHEIDPAQREEVARVPVDHPTAAVGAFAVGDLRGQRVEELVVVDYLRVQTGVVAGVAVAGLGQGVDVEVFERDGIGGGGGGEGDEVRGRAGFTRAGRAGYDYVGEGAHCGK